MKSKEVTDKIEAPRIELTCPNYGNSHIMKEYKKSRRSVRKAITWILYLAIDTIPNKDSKALADRFECTCLKCSYKWKT